LLHLLALARAKPALPNHTAPAATSWIANVGAIALNSALDVRLFLALLGQLVLLLPRFAIGRARIRVAELLEVLADSSSRALGIVAVVSALMGAILAFVGAEQLRQFGAGIYVADLVGIASVRELVPILTAIVLAGRTGANFAARIATMQSNEEIDALTTLGVSPVEFLVLPRVVALGLLMPLLYVYACALVLLSGLAIAVPLLDIPVAEYITRTQHAIGWPNFALGGLKSLVFGALVALLACYRGLQAGRSAADVGLATTSAVVSAIVMIIALDAVFAVCANALGL
jgi:phospholipid/cholesterol/gamma-HCH transport system permease protein